MEVFPNELLIECFKYLDGLDIFYSFDGLNSRFSRLIRHIGQLYIDFRNISTSKYYKICMQLLSDSEIKKQIYSLKLTNKNDYQMKIVESEFSSFDGFGDLRSLSLIDFRENSMSVWDRYVSKLSQLQCFHMIDTSFSVTKYLFKLSISQMKTLTLPVLNSSDLFSNNSSLITNLEISGSTLSTLHDLLTCLANLKYLCVNNLDSYRAHKKEEEVKKLIKNNPSTSLRQLNLKNFVDNFICIAGLLKRTPFLTILTLIDYQDENLFNVNQWQSLIHLELRKLKKFNFTCVYTDHIEYNQIREIFQQLQNDFWLKEHQWFTDCLLAKGSSILYTIPYSYNKYTLKSYSEAFFNKTIDRCQNIFANVRYLNLDFDPVIHKYPYYFPYVTSIDLGQCYFNEEYLKLIKTMVNLTNLNNLSLSSSCKLEQSSILLEILKQSPNLSSLSIDKETFVSLINDDDQLCEYLSKMIRKLTLSKTDDFYQMNKLWKTFKNIEELECVIEKRKSIQFLLEYLPNLSFIKIHYETKDIATELVSFAYGIGLKLGIKIVVETVLDTSILSLWISRIK